MRYAVFAPVATRDPENKPEMPIPAVRGEAAMQARDNRKDDHPTTRRPSVGFAISALTVVVVAMPILSCGDAGVEPSPPPDPVATAVAVTPGSATFSALGETTQFTAEVRDQNGHVMTGVAVTWTSSDAAVAAVDDSGQVTAAANGRATITATAGSASGTAAVTVAQVVSAVAVSPGADTLLAFGDTVRLIAEATDANGHVLAATEFSWASSDTLVAHVDGSGQVTAAANGSATITATAGFASGTAAVTVVQMADSVVVSPAARLKAVGATVQLEAGAFDANGYAVAGAEFSWESSDDAVATVDTAGLVTAVGNGVARISARADAARGSAELTVVDLNVQQYLEENTFIASTMLWLGTDGQRRPYHRWPQPLKDKLALAVEQLLGAGTGLPDIMPHQAVRAGTHYHTYYSKDDAEDLYVANVAHSLVLEMAGALPWSLADLSGHELTLLFDSRQFYAFYDTYEGVTGYRVAGWTPPAPPEFIWDFMEREGLIGTTRQETIIKTIHWARYHLYHYGYPLDRTNYDPDVDHWDYRGGAPTARVLEGTTRKSDGFKGHPTAGCHGTNRVLIHVLRAANIPVEYLVWGGHAVPSFPSEGLYLSHGDDPYSQLAQYASPFPEPFPTSEMLIPEDIYSEWFNASNSFDENLNNVGRRETELGVKYLPQWLLRVRCGDIASGVSNADSWVYRPGTAGIGKYWTVAELEAMNFWERMDAKIAQYGGCSKIPAPRYRGGDG